MIANLKSVLLKAQKEGFAVGAFNTNNMELTMAIIKGAEKTNSPVIVAISEGALVYGGEALVEQAKFMAVKAQVPVVLHLDHGKSVQIVEESLKLGFSSVMFDGSAFTFDKNLHLTKQVVALARKKRVSVEAELGTVGGSKYSEKSVPVVYPTLQQVQSFISKVKIDAIALGLGTSHGVPVPKEHIEQSLLKEIREQIKTPIVLHGASNLPNVDIRQAIRNGVTKINIDTELRQAFTESVRKYLSANSHEIDIRKYLGEASDSVQKLVCQKIELFGSKNKA